jgi:acetyltransferase
MRQAMLDAARPWLLRILGPNCVGLIASGIGLDASFAPGAPRQGKLAFATQSGALATAVPAFPILSRWATAPMWT